MVLFCFQQERASHSSIYVPHVNMVCVIMSCSEIDIESLSVVINHVQ